MRAFLALARQANQALERDPLTRRRNLAPADRPGVRAAGRGGRGRPSGWHGCSKRQRGQAGSTRPARGSGRRRPKPWPAGAGAGRLQTARRGSTPRASRLGYLANVLVAGDRRRAAASVDALRTGSDQRLAVKRSTPRSRPPTMAASASHPRPRWLIACLATPRFGSARRR
jgi:hypothetical protein